MSVKTRILCAVSALCLLGSTACFSVYAAELTEKRSGEEYVEPADPGNTDPGYTDPGYTDPGYTDPGYTDPGNTDPGNTDPGITDPGNTDPGNTDPGNTDPGNTDPGSTDPGYTDPGNTGSGNTAPGYTDPGVTSEYTGEGGYTQPEQPAVTSYVDYTSQYIAYTYEAQYDDNYYYVPTYTEPTESLIEVESEVIDTDELSADDWKSIMLDLEQGNITDGTKTFNFIKNNKETNEDNSLMWMLYLGIGLIMAAVFLIIFVVLSTNKENNRLRKCFP